MIYDKSYMERFLEKQKFIDSVFDAIFRILVGVLAFGLIMCAASMVENIML